MIYCNELKIRYEYSPYDQTGSESWSKSLCMPKLLVQISAGDKDAETTKKSVPLEAWSGPEGSRKLRYPDVMTTAQGGGKVVSYTHRSHLPPGNSPGTHFCYRLSRPQGHSAIGRIMSIKNSNDTIWNRTSDLLICSAAP
jgi:hypothetical protein